MGLRKKLDAAVIGAARALGIRYALAWIRAAAEGKHGEAWRDRYWKLAGKKRLIGLAVGAIAAVATALGYHEAAAYILAVAGFLVSASLLDAAWRDRPPVEDLRGNAVYRFLAEHSAVNTLALGAAFAAVEAGYCGSIDCDTARQVLVALGTVLVYLGLVDAAWLSKPPVIRFERGADGKLIESVVCDRCGRLIPKNEGETYSAGYYKVGPGSGWPSNPGEDVVCDPCMWRDPRYVAVYGRVQPEAAK